MDLVEYMLEQAVQPTVEETRSSILKFEQMIRDLPSTLPPESCPVRHVFAPGVYVREMTIPEGTVLVGKIHRTEHINIISKGAIKVLSEDGVHVVTAPCTFVSKPGIKRVGYALDDTVWSTVHVTNETDLSKIEREVIAEDFSDIELYTEYRRE